MTTGQVRERSYSTCAQFRFIALAPSSAPPSNRPQYTQVDSARFACSPLWQPLGFAMKKAILIPLSFMLLGCAAARERELTEKADAAFAVARASCDNRAKAGELKGSLLYTQCFNAAHLAYWETREFPHSDLLRLKNAKMEALAADFDHGRIDEIHFKSASAQINSDVMSMLEQRTAQRSVATAAIMQASAAQSMAGPKTCQAFGNSVTCY